MTVSLLDFKLINSLKSYTDILKFDQSDSNIEYFNFDDDRVIGNGSGLYKHANNTDEAILKLFFLSSIDISDFTHIFLWFKSNNAAQNFDIKIISDSGDDNYKTYRITPALSNLSNKWKIAKIDLNEYIASGGSLNPANITKIYFISSIANLEVKMNYLVAAKEIFIFDSDKRSILQDLATNSPSSNSVLPILNKNGSSSVNQGSEDDEINIPAFFYGENAFQESLNLKLLKNKGYPLLFELENYAFYPIMIDNISDSNISKETDDLTDKTQIDITIQAHVFNN